MRNGEQWTLRLETGAALKPLQSRGVERVTVPVSIRAGKWLPGVLLPQGVVELSVPWETVSTLPPGRMRATVQGPGYHDVTVVVDTSAAFREDADLHAAAAARLTHFGETTGETVTVPETPGVTFAPLKSPPPTRTVAPHDQPLHLAIGEKARKVFVLASARGLVDRIRLTAITSDGTVTTAPFTLSGPADTRPIAGPRTAGNFVMDLDLGDLKTVDHLYLEVTGAGSAVTIAAISLFGNVRPGEYAALSPRAQAIVGQGTLTLFTFDRPSIAGWETTGNAWGTTDSVGEFFMRKGASRYFADSKAASGEPGTGSILSLPFTLQGSTLTFLANGHSTKNYFALVDAATGEELVRSPVPEKTGPFVKISWDIKLYRGRKVRFKAVDGDNRDAYAWLAFDDVTLQP
jgi:hypothetical protein